MNAIDYGISDDDIQQGKAMATVACFGFLVACLELLMLPDSRLAC